MADGMLVARDAEVLLDGGAYADASPLVAEKAGYRVAGPYRWQHIRSVTDAVLNTADIESLSAWWCEVLGFRVSDWVPRTWPRTPELSDRWGTAGPPSPKMRQHMAGTPDA